MATANKDYMFVNFFPKTNGMILPSVKYRNIELISERIELLKNDKDQQTILNNGDRYRFVIKKDFIMSTNITDLINTLKKIISGDYDSNICPMYIKTNNVDTYYWHNDDFKNTYENKLYFHTF
jgi:hypothetical protein